MNDERDPKLEALFTDSAAESPNDDFTDKVMTSVASRRRNVMIGRIAIVVLIVLLEVLLSAPVQSAVGAFVEVLGTPLLELNPSILATVLSPINSIAGIIGGVLLLVHFLYRKLLR
ncbi:MAG: hypothetical protein OES59_07350 [Gammaproteobacteria bacterium]|jgi:hypothetical protein|nr:hypothetical protein [Gammaproteobacteria bacterium]MDH3778623.1 hypothetical protein [Gammaproteobacteria bacterium]